MNKNINRSNGFNDSLFFWLKIKPSVFMCVDCQEPAIRQNTRERVFMSILELKLVKLLLKKKENSTFFTWWPLWPSPTIKFCFHLFSQIVNLVLDPNHIKQNGMKYYQQMINWQDCFLTKVSDEKIIKSAINNMTKEPAILSQKYIMHYIQKYQQN